MKRRSLFKSLLAAPIIAALPAYLKPKQELPTTMHADALKHLHDFPPESLGVNATSSVCSYGSIDSADIHRHPPLYPHRFKDVDE